MIPDHLKLGLYHRPTSQLFPAWLTTLQRPFVPGTFIAPTNRRLVFKLCPANNKSTASEQYPVAP
jgi:hypothetical protein